MYRDYFIIGEWLAASLTAVGLVTGILGVADSLMLLALIATAYIFFDFLGG